VVDEHGLDYQMNGDDPHYRVLAGWSGGYLDGEECSCKAVQLNDISELKND
jgi:hypothetical protein